jgi:phage tail sheath protein FI
VRRLVNGVKSLIRKAFLPSVFNPNDEYERMQLKAEVDAEAAKVKRGRGINAWETICDTRNNTPAVISNNDMAIDFIIDPEIPASRASLTADIRNFGSSITFNEA